MYVLVVWCIAWAAACIGGWSFYSGFALPSTQVGTGGWIALSYALFSALTSIFHMSTIILEISVHGSESFSSARQVLEVLFLGPLTLVLTSVGFSQWSDNDNGCPVLVFIQYIFVQSVTFLLIVGRLWCAVGMNGMLDHERSHRLVHDSSTDNIPGADFFCTVSNSNDDIWTRRQPVRIMDDGVIGLRRYVTCSGVQDLGNEADLGLARRLSIAMRKATEQDLPKWGQLLSDTARQTRSDSVIGIFCCSQTKMGEAIHLAAEMAEIRNNRQDAYLTSAPVGTLMQNIGAKVRNDVLRSRCRMHGVPGTSRVMF